MTHSLISAGENFRRLSEQASRLPNRPSASTLWRWAKTGIKTNGQTIKLKVVRIGAQLYCSDESMARFLEAINEPDAPAPRPRNRRETAAAVACAERILKRAGV